MSKQKGIAIDLLLIVEEAYPEKAHYVWIKNLARMCYYTSKHKGLKNPCRRYLHFFSRANLLDAHQNDCLGIGEKPQRIVMPEASKNILNFTSYHKQMRVPYVIYAGFECLNVPVEGAPGDPKNSSSRQISKQVPCSYCYVIVRSDGVVGAAVLYRGENAVERFLNSLQAELRKINVVFAKPKNIIMTEDDRASFAEATDCHICGLPLQGEGEDKVRDHCHITGKYRGATHNGCNLSFEFIQTKQKYRLYSTT